MISRIFRTVLAVLFLASTFSMPAMAQGQLHKSAGMYVASVYNSGSGTVFGNPVAAGASSLTLTNGYWTLSDGHTFYPYFPNETLNISNGSGTETLTVLSSTGCATGNGNGSCVVTFTGTTANAHGSGDLVTSGSSGLDEAIQAAHLGNGGTVVADQNGITAATIAAAAPLYANVQISSPAFGPFHLAPTATTFMATPTTLVSTTVGSNLGLAAGVAGSASWGSTVYACVTYVDAMGNEGPCSATYNFSSTASQAIGFTAPAASTGAVGWIPYLSVSGGSYALAYMIPVTSSVCTMTTVETVLPACAITNNNYGETGAGAVVTGYPVVTSQIAPQLGGTASTTDYIPNSNAHTVYAYVPGAAVGLAGVVASSQPFTAAPAPATTVPATMGMIQLPAGFMNTVGKTIRVCGNITEASSGSTATISTIQFFWDAQGSNVTGGYPVLLNNLEATNTLVTSNADVWNFCQDLQTTVAGSGATAGSIQAMLGQLIEGYGTVGAHTYAAFNTNAAAIASLNLAVPARLQVVYLHVTGTDGATPILSDLTVQVLN